MPGTVRRSSLIAGITSLEIGLQTWPGNAQKIHLLANSIQVQRQGSTVLGTVRRSLLIAGITSLEIGLQTWPGNAQKVHLLANSIKAQRCQEGSTVPGTVRRSPGAVRRSSLIAGITSLEIGLRTWLGNTQNVHLLANSIKAQRQGSTVPGTVRLSVAGIVP